jgi:hypothetical protein
MGCALAALRLLLRAMLTVPRGRIEAMLTLRPYLSLFRDPRGN